MEDGINLSDTHTLKLRGRIANQLQIFWNKQIFLSLVGADLDHPRRKGSFPSLATVEPKPNVLQAVLLRIIKLSNGSWNKLPSRYFESITTLLFNYSPYFVEDALSEISISHDINCFNIVCWEKAWQHFRVQEQSKQILFSQYVRLCTHSHRMQKTKDFSDGGDQGTDRKELTCKDSGSQLQPQ